MNTLVVKEGMKLGYIIDLSHHQLPSQINYDKLAAQLDFAIIRTQYGSNLIDRHYKTHHAELRKRGVPTAAYAWVRGVSIQDMEKEAIDFYNRTKDIKPTFWFLDVEEESMKDMRAGVSAYLRKLKSLGAEKVGIYIAHHLYEKFNLNLAEADAVWIPHYGRNTGKVDSTPKYPCDIHQYTDKGKLTGYSGYLDLNRLMGTKPLEYFTGETKPKEEPVSTYSVHITINGYYTAYDAMDRRNPRTRLSPGEYYIFREFKGMLNLTRKKGVPGSWVNPNDNTSSNHGTTFKVGDVVRVKKTAEKYATGQSIPSWVKSSTFKIQQVKTDRVLLKEIVSWVYIKDIEKV